MMKKYLPLTFSFSFLFFISCKQEDEKYDTIIRNGIIYDGNGGDPFKADIGINADTIAFIGNLSNASAKKEVDAKGNAVAPGFVNMLSWAVESLIEDGRSQSDIKQGVTLEVMGEGGSMGPWNASTKWVGCFMMIAANAILCAVSTRQLYSSSIV